MAYPEKTDAVISLGPDMTVRWACRAGDYMLWASYQGILSNPGDPYTVADLWELRDGNFVTITNRRSDLPDWFQLHPSEVSGALHEGVGPELEGGYSPDEPMEGPNLWRIRAGDRLVWVGPARGKVGEGTVQGLLNCTSDALVYGEPWDFSRGFPAFGGFDRQGFSQEGVRLAREGWKAMCSWGPPRVAAADSQWRLP